MFRITFLLAILLVAANGLNAEHPKAPSGSDSEVIVIPGDAGSTNDLMTNADDPASWTLETHNRAAATIRQEDGGLRVDITQRTGQRWDLQLYQAGKSMAPGRIYVLRFQARAVMGVKMWIVTVQGANDPWKIFGGTTQLDVATTWKQYTLRFPVNSDAAGPMRSPIFQLGEVPGTVWLRNITLAEAAAK